MASSSGASRSLFALAAALLIHTGFFFLAQSLISTTRSPLSPTTALNLRFSSLQDDQASSRTVDDSTAAPIESSENELVEMPDENPQSPSMEPSGPISRDSVEPATLFSSLDEPGNRENPGDLPVPEIAETDRTEGNPTPSTSEPVESFDTGDEQAGEPSVENLGTSETAESDESSGFGTRLEAFGSEPVVTAVSQVPAVPDFSSLNLDGARFPAPLYPEAARRLGQEGVVVVEILFGTRGRPEDVRILESSGYPLLDEEVVATISRRWRVPQAAQGTVASKSILFVLEDPNG